jgi:predicted lipoprotein with Yx(FWY)xxD motif
MYDVFRKTYALAAIVALALCFSHCSDDDPQINTGEVTLQSNATLGNFLVDGKGMTLYYFTKDVNNQSNCTGNCLVAWPIYYAEDIKPGTGISATDFTTITRADGSKQTAYKNWPLYYYVGDTKAGDVTGEAVENEWFVAKPDYTIMLTDAQLVGKDGKSYVAPGYAQGTGTTQFFVDVNGRTLYTFSKDYKNTNKFTAADLSNNTVWPMYNATIQSLPSTLKASDFGSITVHGRTQTTYKGNPLYYFGEDTKHGDTKGVSVPTPGIWPVATPGTPTAADQPTIMIRADATLGNVLTDNQGRTLYYFARDTKGTSSCTGGCLTRWPFFNVENIVVPQNSGLNTADFGHIGTGATAQVTYKGRPLYYYSAANDGTVEPAGQNGGDNFGTVWYVASPDYNLMVASAQLVGNDGKNYIISGGAFVEGNGNTRYYTDAAGRTLYLFTNDAKDTNTFTNGDAGHDANWPIFHVEVGHLPSALNEADFGEIEVNGASQLTYKGWPLYYFGGDANKGDTKGVSVPTPGKWPIINENTAEAELP